MDYEEMDALRRQSTAWRLLRADNVVLVLSFLGRVFVTENVRSISATDLAGRLDDELYALNERLGEGTFPRRAKAYLDDWSDPKAGYLRKYYPEGSDEPFYDATPAVEKALSWLRSLTERSFVGTESRLNTIFDLLRQMVFGAEADPSARLEELHRRRAELDQEIMRVEAGDFRPLEPTAQRDRYQQLTRTARELLADFREVESNFRVLDRRLREKISTWEGSKGALLDDILSNRESITDSDQGKSFQAFYDFLLSRTRQEEGVDTKFIERHRGDLAVLLDLQLPPERIRDDLPRSDFAGRYGFRRKPDQIRFRFLDDTRLAGFSELTVRTAELTARPPGVVSVYVIENEVSYLAFPPVPGGLAIFGGGYAVGLLQQLDWLAETDLTYWGDLDTHGFAILHRLRSHFPHVASMLMDEATLLSHRPHWTSEPSQVTHPLSALSPTEAALYQDLCDHRHGVSIRLEQERIRFSTVHTCLTT